MKQCNDCPEKESCWTLRMIARMLELGITVNKAHCSRFEFVREK